MKILSTIILFMLSSLAFGQKTYLHCGQLFDSKTGKLLKEMTIVVEGNSILEVNKGYTSPESAATTIDLKNKTVLPGLIDMHVHIEKEINPKAYVERFTMNKEAVALQSTVYAKRTLMAGFTTVRDLGGTGANIALRDAINKGYVDGPRIYTSGKSLGTTGGHADPTNGMKDPLMGDPGPAQGVVNSPEDGRKAVRQRYKNGADVIKITATGGVLSVAKNGQNPQFTIEEIKAICETAKDYGMHVAAHAHGDEGMQRAILGGVKTIEHGTKMSEETMAMMIERDVYYVPTITAGKEVGEKAKVKGYYPEVIVPKALEIGPKIQGTFGKAIEKGVKIAFGTDAGVFPHGLNGKEFYYMVEAGMSEKNALLSATSVNAALLKNSQIGYIGAGMLADIIAVDDNPLTEIKTMENVTFVMKNGVVYKN